MKKRFNPFITAGLTAGIFGTALSAMPSAVLAAPASNQLLRDVGVGAAASTATGLVTGDGISLNNVVTGAAAGAAVSAIGSDNSSLARDAAVGAIAGGLAGRLTNSDPFLENALRGAAAGAAINTMGGNNAFGRNVFGSDGFDSDDLSDLLGGERQDDNIFSRRSICRRVIGTVGRRVGRRVLGEVLGNVLGR